MLKYKEFKQDRFYYIYKNHSCKTNKVVPLRGNAVILSLSAKHEKALIVHTICRALIIELGEALHSIILSEDLWYIEIAVLPEVYDEGELLFLDLEKLTDTLFTDYGISVEVAKEKVPSFVIEPGLPPVVTIYKPDAVMLISLNTDHHYYVKTFAD